jgi:hypothetical protein
MCSKAGRVNTKGEPCSAVGPCIGLAVARALTWHEKLSGTLWLS